MRLFAASSICQRFEETSTHGIGTRRRNCTVGAGSNRPKRDDAPGLVDLGHLAVRPSPYNRYKTYGAPKGRPSLPTYQGREFHEGSHLTANEAQCGFDTVMVMVCALPGEYILEEKLEYVSGTDSTSASELLGLHKACGGRKRRTRLVTPRPRRIN